MERSCSVGMVVDGEGDEGGVGGLDRGEVFLGMQTGGF